MMNQSRQRGNSMIMGLLVLLVVVIFGIFALYRVTSQQAHMRMTVLDRLLQSESEALIMQIRESLRRQPDGTLGPFKTVSPDVRYTIESRDQGVCLAMGSDLTQKYRCRSVEVAVALDDGPTFFNTSPLTRTYTVDFQYPVKPEEISG